MQQNRKRAPARPGSRNARRLPIDCGNGRIVQRHLYMSAASQKPLFVILDGAPRYITANPDEKGRYHLLPVPQDSNTEI